MLSETTNIMNDNNNINMTTPMVDIAVAENVNVVGKAAFAGEAFAPAPVMRTVPQFDKVTDDSTADVRSILGRPKFHAKYTFDNFGYYHQVSLDNSLYRDFFNISERFAGAFGARFTTCFRVVVAAAPQVGGLLRLYYNPVGEEGVNGIIHTYKDLEWTSLNPTAYTQLPGAELNLQDATAIDYKIPYTHFLDFMPLDREGAQENNMSLGSFNIVSYLPVHYEPSTTVPEISIYIWLEDIEIIGARNFELDAYVISQSGTMSKIVEEDVENDGPLSGPLYKLGKAASLVGGAIPLLSSVTQPISWATRIASKMTAAFGYSRPLILEAPVRNVITQNHYQNNADGPDASFNLGLLQDSKLKVSDNIGGTNVDEMSLSYLTSKPAAITVFKVPAAADGLRYHVALCPRSMYQGGLDLNQPFYHVPNNWLSETSTPPGFNQYLDNTLYVPTPLFWLSTMFKSYRGGFKIKVKTNKTRFHGGRMLLTFTPFAPLTPDLKVTLVPRATNGTYGGTDLLGISKVWDLRESSEIEFECPYTAITPYLEVDQPFGSFAISVCDKITAPENVYQFLDFAVEVCGMDDFEFAMPQQAPYIANPMDDHRKRGTKVDALIVSQSGDIEYACDCIGEKVMSVKQLLSRSEWTAVGTWRNFFDPTGSTPTTEGVRLPQWFESFYGTGYVEAATRYAGTYKVSTHDLVSSAYAFARGSTCYDLVSDGNKPTLFSITQSQPSLTGTLGSGSQVWESWKYNKVRTPFYACTKKLPTNPAFESVVSQKSDLEDIPATNYTHIKMRPRVFAKQTDLISRRAGDDAQLGFFMCAPRVRYTGTTREIKRFDWQQKSSVDVDLLASKFE